MSESQTKSIITPEEAFANHQKADAVFEASIKGDPSIKKDAQNPLIFNGKLSKEQTEAYSHVLATTAILEATHLDGIGGRPNNVLEPGEYVHKKSDRANTYVNQAWHEILEKSNIKGMNFSHGIPDISDVSSETLNSIIKDKKAAVDVLSKEKDKTKVVAVKVGDSELNLTVEAAITFHKDVAGFAEVLKNAKQGKFTQEKHFRIIPNLPHTIKNLEPSRQV